MSRDPQLRLEDILDAIQSIEQYIEGYAYERFVQDRKTVDAVTRCLEIVGEAVKHLPHSMTNQFPEIPWRAICGFRDVLAHSYFRAEDSIIWDAANRSIGEVKVAIQSLLRL